MELITFLLEWAAKFSPLTSEEQDKLRREGREMWAKILPTNELTEESTNQQRIESKIKEFTSHFFVKLLLAVAFPFAVKSFDNWINRPPSGE